MKFLPIFSALILLSTKVFSNTVNASSGNLSDVQSAVNRANPGDTVMVPAGSFSWKSGLSITKALTCKAKV